MTTSVDVLTTWTEMADSIATRRDECLGRGQFIQAEIYREMLAKHERSMIAVYELIEACESLQQHPDDLEIQADFCRALARVKGA